MFKRSRFLWFLAGGLCGLSILLPNPESEAQTLQPPRSLLQWGGEGDAPGKFSRPVGIAAGPEGFVYVSDTENQRIQKFTADGEFVLKWGVGGRNTGEVDRPMHLEVSPDGKVYVAEFLNDRIQVFDHNGKSLALIESGDSESGQMDAPGGVAVDRQGRVFVADFYNHRIQRFAPDFTPLPSIGKQGRVFGGNFDYPTDVAIGPHGFLYVADAYNNRIQKFTLEGDFVSKWGGLWGTGLKGTSPGFFNVATGIEVDKKGRVYVADYYNNRIQVFTSDGDFLVEFGSPGNAPGAFDRPSDMAIDSQGYIFVVDFGNHRIQKFTPLKTNAE